MLFFGADLLLNARASDSPISSHRRWRGLANCLGVSRERQRSNSSGRILRFIHEKGYMLVPPSNPPTEQEVRKSTRQTRSTVSLRTRRRASEKCPFQYAVKRFTGGDVVPRYMSYATCQQCNAARCQPVYYTHKVLIKNCNNVWFWGERTLPVAYIWVKDD